MSSSPKRFSILFGVSALALCAAQAQAQMVIPSDVDPNACPVDIQQWFPENIVTENGAVHAPSSVTFTTDNSANNGPNVCNFYQWGAQAFLWLTSPEGEGLVLDGESIYNVLPSIDGKRHLQDASTSEGLNVALRAEKSDDNIDETGQAGGGGVLMSQGKSLVYYGVHVNDGYAEFLTGQKAGKIQGDPQNFPHNAAEMLALERYIAQAKQPELGESEAMVLELKTSWVDASTLRDPSQFITMPAQIPSYTANADNTEWSVGPAAPGLLALVGAHVVGTVQDHPEFIWATFEHVSNAPDVQYHYITAQGVLGTSPYTSQASFVFLPDGAPAEGANVECMKTAKGSTGDIVAHMKGSDPLCSGGIVPSNTVRTRPWGSLPLGPEDIGKKDFYGMTVTRDQVTQVLKNNTMLLAINNGVMNQLAPGDVRGNYVQTGGIWTTTPSAGADAPIPNQTGDQTANLRGSLGLYNATMETYSSQATAPSGYPAPNCFSCHSLSKGDNSFVPFGLSHIYSEIQPIGAKD